MCWACTEVQMFRSTDVQMYRCLNILITMILYNCIILRKARKLPQSPCRGACHPQSPCRGACHPQATLDIILTLFTCFIIEIVTIIMSYLLLHSISCVVGNFVSAIIQIIYSNHLVWYNGFSGETIRLYSIGLTVTIFTSIPHY